MASESEYRRRSGDLYEDEPSPLKGWVVAHCDGGSRGNPGPSGFGVLIEDKNGAVIAELSEFLGRRTNNYAEYSALLAALNFAVEQGHPRLRVISDSELMVKQIKGQYRVNSPELKSLHEEARHRIALLEGFDIQHVLREKNRKADELANLAMDRGMGRGGGVGGPLLVQPAEALPAAGPQPIPMQRRPVPASRPLGSEPGRDSRERNAREGDIRAAKQSPVRGFVKGGVVHLLDGATLPDGLFVKVTREE